MGTISSRLPEDIEADLEEYIEEERLDRSTAVRKLLAEGLDAWKRDRALELLDRGEVSFTRAAELADCTVWEFVTLAKDRDVTWVDEDHLADDLDSL
jgi:Arc/MetJ-type ribon-helix-helix transcriptional regulator